MGRVGFSASPIVLGLILGPIAEAGFVQGTMIGAANDAVMAEFFGRPISIGIISMICLGLLSPLLMRRSGKNAGDKA